MPGSKLPSLAVAECGVGPWLLQLTVSPTFTVTPPGENLKSLMVTPVEAAAFAMVVFFGLSTGASSSMTGWAAAAAGSAGAAGAGAGAAVVGAGAGWAAGAASAGAGAASVVGGVASGAAGAGAGAAVVSVGAVG